jgi:hypothetical protein
MTPAVETALGGALGAVLLAALAYVTAVLQAHTRALAAHAVALAALGERAAAGSAPGAGSARGGGALARPYPLWSQLADPLPTGALPAQGYEECGEECCAMVIYAQHGCALEADALRFALGGAARTGLTTGEDLVRILRGQNVAAALQQVAGAEVAARLRAITAEGRAAICLGAWITPGVLHWVLVTRADAAGCGYNDPWGGLRKTAPWRDFTGRYAGELVEVTRAPDPLG